MADLEKTVAIIFNATTGPAIGSIDKLQQGVTGIGEGAGKAVPQVTALDAEVDKLGGKSALVDTLSDAFAGLAAGITVGAFVDANVNAETFIRTMTLLNGSVDAAGAEFEYVKKLANTLGLELFSTADAYAQLTASTRGTSLEGQKTRDIFEAVASSMSALGRSSADTQGALLAISQMVSKGTVSMEELRGQLGERLPGAFQVAADAMGMTTQGLIEMVSKGELTSDVFLPKFAAALESVYGGVQHVETFTAAWNRLQNTLQETFISLGDSGAMKAATKGIDTIAFSLVATTAGAQYLGSAIRNILDLLATGDVSGYMKANADITEVFGASVQKSYDALFGLAGQMQKTGEAGVTAGTAIDEGMKTGALSTKQMAEAAKLVDESLKKLGIDPKQFVDPVEVAVEQIQGVIKDMVNNPATNGDEMLAGLLVAMDKLSVEELPALSAAAQGAFEAGTLSAEQFDIALDALKSRQNGLWPTMEKVTAGTGKQADALKKTEENTRKAEDAAKKYELELLKLASNEKIATIESRVQLNIAELESNAKIATALLDNIGQTYVADVSLIGDLMSQIGDGRNAADRLRISFAESADRRIEELHSAQLALIAAQVEYLNAKTNAAAAGNPLVTIQADGLQPHLEAFMWEILGAIQVKMAYDGGDFLVGGCTL